MDTGGDALGLSVGINESGNTVVAGAIDATIPPPPATGGNQYQGAVYVFVETGGVWATPTTPTTFNAKLFASDATADSHLGWSVGISGNTVVAGAYQADIGSNAGQGAAYVFVDPGPTPSDWVTPTTTPTFNAKLTASDGAADDEFGTSVAISGSTVVVGAASTAGGTGTGASAAYVFAEPGGGWVPTPPPTQTQELLAPAAGDAFGNSVGISGNTIVVGAYGATNGSGLATGAAYVFTNTIGPGPYAQFSTSTPSSPPQVGFGNVVDGVPATQTVTVTNMGTQTLTIQMAPLPAGSVFTVTGYTCIQGGLPTSPSYPINLSPGTPNGDSCTYMVQFDPTAPGAVMGGLGFVDTAGQSNLASSGSAPNFSQSVPLSGTGVTAGIVTTTTINSTTGGHLLPPAVALVGDPITVNFTVTPAADNPTGTVMVTDGLGDPPCSEVLTTANAGVGSCLLTINVLPAPPSFTTLLTAIYTPDQYSPALPASASNPFTEGVAEVVAPCGAAVAPQTVRQNGIATFTWTVCLAGNENTLIAIVNADCVPFGHCSVPPPTSLGNNTYAVTLNITTYPPPPGNGSPGNPSQMIPLLRGGPGSWPLPLIGFGALLGMLMVLQVVRQNRVRPRLLPAAGILASIMLSGMSGCSNSGGVTPVGTYTINVTLTAGTFQVIVPVTLNVTK